MRAQGAGHWGDGRVGTVSRCAEGVGLVAEPSGAGVLGCENLLLIQKKYGLSIKPEIFFLGRGFLAEKGVSALH